MATAFEDLGQDLPPSGPLLGAISRAVVQIFRRRVGRGPTEAKSYWAGRDLLVVVMSGGALRIEETLWEAGRRVEVEAGRAAVQDVLEQELRGAVEELTGREVHAFLSASRLEPEVTAELFLLTPDAAG